MFVLSLQRRILETLATSTLLVACGGQTDPTGTGSSSGASSSTSSSGSSGTSGGSSSGDPAPTCAGDRKQHQCYAPEGIITKNSGYGGVRDPDAAPPPPPTRDANGCVVIEEVMSGCCNPAIAGPTVEGGKCCYDFCAGACCGRPLIVDGVARRASQTRRDDWVAALRPQTPLDRTTRDTLRDDWTRDALLEHASIASFATFTLELLALGAPVDLVRDAQAAASDEIEHARLTFAIASSYSDSPIGPGALDLGGVSPSTRLAAIAAACVRDGCMNETLASAIASAQAKNAVAPDMRATLERIAEDEARHAELAWRFVRWALARGADDVRAAVAAAFDAPIAFAPAIPAGVDVDAWRAHGRLTATEHTTIVRSVLDQVIAPCRKELFRTLDAPAQA